MKPLPSRHRALNSQSLNDGPVIYWMNREMRIHDNWALLYAQQLAESLNQPLIIVFSLFKRFETALNTPEDKMFYRMKIGLKRVSLDSQALSIPFYMLGGDTVSSISKFAQDISAGAVVTDFSPLRAMRSLREHLARVLSISFIEVDAHNIIPVWVASDKQEWGAYTLRPKIHRLLEEYLISYPSLKKQNSSFQYLGPTVNDWLESTSEILDTKKVLETFITQRLPKYEERNNPNVAATSGLSSYLHFGHISSQTVALLVQNTGKVHEIFLEELIVRKELADNYCFYNPHYDSFEGFPDWAKKTLNAHRHDQRAYLYDYQALAEGKTHDDAWNACQLQMVQTGYMHGYMRMYWAKKILEWTSSPEEALAIANRLNDTYELDGRDPNGYTGTAWAIGGVHDRPWQERPIFGMIRYMNFEGLKRKFDIGAYIRTWLGTSLLK
jgi:deoxyribodipyrimidine photo-lyase